MPKEVAHVLRALIQGAYHSCEQRTVALRLHSRARGKEVTDPDRRGV